MPARIVIIIVTYNRSALLRECLSAVLRQTVAPAAVVLVDNHSTDDTPAVAQAFAAADDRVHPFRTPSNLGGAGGYAWGIRCAAAFSPDAVWLMDDDTVCAPDALAELLQAAGRVGEYGFLAGRVLWTDGTPCRMNVPLFAGGEEYGLPRLRKATFVSLLIPWRVVEQVGLPIAEFFIWGDDQEYTDRISRRWPCYYAAQSVAVHKTASNHGSDLVRDDADRIDRYRYKYRNELYISRRTGVLSLGYYAWRALGDAVRILLLSDGKARRLAVLWQGVRSGLSFAPRVQKLESPANPTQGEPIRYAQPSERNL